MGLVFTKFKVMKQMSIIILFCFLSLKLSAPPDAKFYVAKSEVIRPYEQIWKATCKIESNNNPFAIGDKNLKSHSYGIVQIRKSRIDDFYKETGIRYSLTDMFDTLKSKQVFMWYAHGDNETIARSWNGGKSGMSKKSTLKYWQKIQAIL